MSVAISLQLENRKVYIIGGGHVAYRKACEYQSEGAIVSIIAPQICEECYQHSFTCMLQPFSWSVIIDAFLIYVATNDEQLNHTIVKEANKRRILCGCATRCQDASFTSMRQVDFDHLQVAMSTKSAYPYANSIFLKELMPQLECMNKKSAHLQIIREYMLAHTINIETIVSELINLELNSLFALIEAITKNKDIIILAYHGVANIDDVACDMQDMKQLCLAYFKHSIPLTTFISDKIITKAKHSGFAIDHVEKVARICEHLQIPFVIQPMLVSDGIFMKSLQSSFPTQKIGNVLCASLCDIQEIVLQIRREVKQPLCLLYHPSSSDIAQQLKSCVGVMSYAYDEEIPSFSNPILPIQSFSILLGYHARKDIQNKWISALQKQGVKPLFQERGLLSYPFVRMKFIERIQTIL